MTEGLPHISVIIPTRNRASSLKITLECLQSADRAGICADVVVVDNAGTDNTREVVESFRLGLPVRYLHEPVLGTYGKSYALNRALDASGLGDIIAVLDDDISPDPNWFQAVTAICQRWPDKDIFTGHVYVVWPSGEVPEWARSPRVQRLVLSASSFGPSDAEMRGGQWYAGGHFWFRSRALQHGPRFKDCWLTEPNFQLDLFERGFGGVASPEARAGHRVQPELLERKMALSRARSTGMQVGALRLQPYRTRVKQARLMHAHPLLGRLFCQMNRLRWQCLFAASYLYPTQALRFERRLIAAESIATYSEIIRTARRLPEYSLRKRIRSEAANSSLLMSPVAGTSSQGKQCCPDH